MRENGIIFFISCLIVAVIIYIFFLSKNAVIKNKIKKNPQKKIGDVKDGESVHIRGTVVLAGRTLIAPLSKRNCAYYCVKVRRGPDNRVYEDYTRFDKEKGADLVIQDGEDYAIIDTKLVSAYLHQDDDHRYEPWNFNMINLSGKNSATLKEFLEKNGMNTTGFGDFYLDLYATEGVLEEGETIAVAGKASWRDSKQFKIKIPSKKVLYIQPLDEHGVYVTEDLY